MALELTLGHRATGLEYRMSVDLPSVYEENGVRILERTIDVARHRLVDAVLYRGERMVNPPHITNGPRHADPWYDVRHNLTATEVRMRQDQFFEQYTMEPMSRQLSAALDREMMEMFTSTMLNGLSDLSPAQHQQHQEKVALQRQADEKAEKLLVGALSAAQKTDWAKYKTFMATGGTTGVNYKLTTNRTYGIETYLYGRKIGRLCVVAKDSAVPIYDQLLAQKLLIETDEEAFLKLANCIT